MTVGNRLVVPQSMREETIKQLHSTHQGIEKARLAAKESFFWPGISSDLKNAVERCEACQQMLPSQPAEPLKDIVKPIMSPMELVSADLYDFQGKDYLVIADAYSGFVESERLPRTTSSEIIKAFEKFFSIVGYPARLRSDNAPNL